MAKALGTYVYVDGFNLYYRAVRHTQYKWLDILKLCQATLGPGNKINQIRYFTANVSGRRDPDAPIRQQAYLRALSTIPQLTIHKGRFLVATKWAKIADPPPHFIKPDPVTVSIVKTEEKGSDVNLASHLLNDGFNKRYDVAVVPTNDTDLVEPMRMVRADIGKPIGLLCPSNNAHKSLQSVADFIKHITRNRLARAQFPDPIPGTSIHKPPSW